MQNTQKTADLDVAELERLNALAALQILDTAPEQNFDDIVLLASQFCDTPVALVSLVTNDRQWFKARLGFDACETTLDQSVCRHAMHADDLFVIPDLTQDARTNINPLVTHDPQIRFYAGAPLRTRDGVPLGALCVIDTRPRPEGLTPTQRACLLALSRQVCTLMESRTRLEKLDAAKRAELESARSELADERRIGLKREELVTMLGQDIRNPLGAIISAIQILERDTTGMFLPRVLPVIKASCEHLERLADEMFKVNQRQSGDR